MIYLVECSDHKDVETLKKMFDEVDLDGDHQISYRELVTALTHEHIRAGKRTTAPPRSAVLFAYRKSFSKFIFIGYHNYHAKIEKRP